MSTFTHDQLAVLALGSEELNRKKREINLVAELVGNFLIPHLQHVEDQTIRFDSAVVGQSPHRWEFQLFAKKKPHCKLLMNYHNDGLRLAYSNVGEGTMAAHVKAVHDLLPALINKVLKDYPAFEYYIKPMLEAGEAALAA